MKKLALMTAAATIGLAAVLFADIPIAAGQKTDGVNSPNQRVATWQPRKVTGGPYSRRMRGSCGATAKRDGRC